MWFVVVFQVESMSLLHNEFPHVVFPNFHREYGKFSICLEPKLIAGRNQMCFVITQRFFRRCFYRGKESGLNGWVDWIGLRRWIDRVY